MNTPHPYIVNEKNEVIVITQFKKETKLLINDPRCHETIQDLYNAYSQWHKAHNVQPITLEKFQEYCPEWAPGTVRNYAINHHEIKKLQQQKPVDNCCLDDQNNASPNHQNASSKGDAL